MSTHYTLKSIIIPLTQGQFAYVSPIDAKLATLKWYVANYRGFKYAARKYRTPDNRRLSVGIHRVIWEMVIGRPLESHEYIDHIDGNGLNNRRENLRIATHIENCRNQRISKRNTSGVKGVYWDTLNKRWTVKIRIGGKKKHIGCFVDIEDARKAYREASQEYHKEFANSGLMRPPYRPPYGIFNTRPKRRV